MMAAKKRTARRTNARSKVSSTKRGKTASRSRTVRTKVRAHTVTRGKTRNKTKRSTARTVAKKHHVVKRKGHKETFDERKLYASIYAAALNCHYTDTKSEKIAAQATKDVKKWVRKKSSVESHEIRAQALDVLKDDDVLLMYKHHLDLS